MANLRIEEILYEVDRFKKLDHNDFNFYNLNYIRSRNQYKDYIKTNDPNSFLNCAVEYVKNNNLELSVINRYSEIFLYTKGGDIEKTQIELLSNNLKSLFDTMEKSGIKDLLIKKHNMRCVDNDLDALAITEDQFDAEFDSATNNRSKLSMLYLKNTFWMQRYLKMFRDIQLQGIISKNFEEIGNTGANPDDLNYLLFMSFKKYSILNYIYSKEKEHKGKEETILSTYKDFYKNTFDDVFPNVDNDIYKDYKEVHEYKSVLDNLSARKDIFLSMLLKNQISEARTNPLSQTIKNWGVKKNKQSVVFAFEPEGYMLGAIFTHAPIYVPTKVLTTPQMRNYPFPEFQPMYSIIGSSSKILSPIVLAKPTSEQIKEIKLQSKQKGPNQDMFKRVLCQINGKPYSYEKCEIVKLNDLEDFNNHNGGKKVEQSRED